MIERAHVSVRVCWPPVHAPQGDAVCSDQVLNTQSTGATTTVAAADAAPPGPVTTSV